MADTIEITRIEKDNHTIRVSFRCGGNIRRYFRAERFEAEYAACVDSVPDSVAVIPFVCNVLPIVWLAGAELTVPSLDETFRAHLEGIREGYRHMYPNLTFGGKVSTRKTADEFACSPTEKGKACTLFSGGVDAFSTLLHHIDEKPVLLTVWGADIRLDDGQGWQNTYRHTVETARHFGLEASYVKTNFREFIDETALNLLAGRSGDTWWHGFQHGIGLTGHAAPLAFLQGFRVVYIASSYATHEVKCASVPEIDEQVAFGRCHVVHDQYMYPRQQKVHDICAYAKRTGLYPSVRVCWESRGGKNCGYCEKCLRTVYGLIAEGADPNDFGFCIEAEKAGREARALFRSCRFPVHNLCFWEEIQARYRENLPGILPRYREAGEWLLSADLGYFRSRRYRLRRLLFALRAALQHKDTLLYLIKKKLLAQ